MELFHQALPHIQEREIERARIQEEELVAAAAETVAQQTEQNRQQGNRQLVILLAVLGVLAFMVISVAAAYRYFEAERRARLASDFATAATCLEIQDYQCALAGFESVVERDASYEGARLGLRDARIGLAGQFAASGQWDAAIGELELALEIDPANLVALTLLRDAYDRWIQDALGRGDFVRALGLRLQRNARFPNEPIAPLPTPTPDSSGDI